MLRVIRANLVSTSMGLACICAAVLTVWACVIEPGSLQIREYELTLPKWPSGLSGLRIAILADLHTGSPFNGLDKLRRIVADTNAARPDLIVIPGDIVMTGVLGGEFVPPESIAFLLQGLQAPLGVYAVLGNHDRGLDTARIELAFKAAGIPTLEDRGIWIPVKQQGLWLVGVSDFWTGAHNVTLALSQVSGDRPMLMMTHNPDLFPEVPNCVALTIAGHTHGGQVSLPVVGRPIVPSRYGERYAIGHIVEEGRHLFVSPGLGTSILPIRMGVPPEISIVTLVGPRA
ncbi:MAG: metallophosphoesterase [Nitrospira sp.]|nr:metallophosphoesterase [Nitrospira sp.]